MAMAASVMHPEGGVRLARADEDVALSRARAKFQQATELAQAGNYAAALQLFREVGQVRMTPQVRFHIGACEEKLGRLVAALGAFELARAGAADVGFEFQQELEERIEDVRARIPKVVIERGEGAQAATIELDGVILGANSIGTEVPLDPGPHSIQAEAPGYHRYASTIDLAEREVKQVEIVLEPAPSDAVPEPRSPDPTPPVFEAPPRRSRTVPYVLGASGAALLLNAGVFYLLYRDQDSALRDLCGTDRDCTNAAPRPLIGEEVSRADDMNGKLRVYTTVSGVSAVVGILALGVAGVWVFTEPKQPKPATAWTIQPAAPGAALGGLSLLTAF